MPLIYTVSVPCSIFDCRNLGRAIGDTRPARRWMVRWRCDEISRVTMNYSIRTRR